MNIEKLKEAREKLEAAEADLEKEKSEALKQYREFVKKAENKISDLKKEYAKVTQETKEELEKAGLEFKEKPKWPTDTYVIDRRFYPFTTTSTNVDPRDLANWPDIPLLITPSYFRSNRKHPDVITITSNTRTYTT